MTKMMLSPGEIADATVNAGKTKCAKSIYNLFILGILAGMFIAFGAVGAIVIWSLSTLPAVGKFLGAAIFPVGIMFVVLAGSELFTGNSLMTLGMFKGEYKVRYVMKNWTIVYLGNFVGSILLAFLIYKSNLWGANGTANVIGAKAIAIAEGKVGLSFSAALYRGILCNMVVVLAIWISSSSKDVIGKIFALWFPITLFVLSGYEHSIANMFFISVGMFMGGDVTWSTMFMNNLIPVTIGNIIGGAVVIPGLYCAIFGKKNKEK